VLLISIFVQGLEHLLIKKIKIKYGQLDIIDYVSEFIHILRHIHINRIKGYYS
jgi:hypothetical protein